MRRKKTYRGLRSSFSGDRYQFETGRKCSNELSLEPNQQPFTRRPLMLSLSHRSRIASIVVLVLLMPALHPYLAAARAQTSNTTTAQSEQDNKKQDKKK